jgi:Na+/proline symporter
MEWGWMGIGIGISLLFIAFFVAQRVKNLNQTTVADMLVIRYGTGARCVAAGIIMIGDFAVFSAMIASFRKMISGYIGLSSGIALVITVLIFMISANMGGIKGIAYTDLVQSIIILLGVVLVGFMAFSRAGGFVGISQLGSKMLNPFTPNIPAFTMIGNVVSLVGMFFVSQSTLMQKINSTKSPEDARKAVVTMAITVTIGIVVFIGMMGISSRVLFGNSISNPDDVIVTLLSSMPVILGTLYAAAIISAVLTTANAMLLSSSMSFSNDLLRTFKPDATDKLLLVSSKLYIVAACALGYIVVQYIPGVITWILLAYTIQASLIIPLYAGLLWKRPSGRAGFISLLISGLSILIWEFIGKPFGIHSVFIGLATAAIALLLATFADKKSATPEQQLVVEAFRNNCEYKPTKQQQSLGVQ